MNLPETDRKLHNSPWTESTLSRLAELGEELTQAELGRVASPKRLAVLVGELSRLYTRERGDLHRAAGPEHLEARLRFFLARDALKSWNPLREIWSSGSLPERSWSVLDLGAGVGATALGVTLFAGQRGVTSVDLTLVEPDPVCVSVLGKLSERLSAFAGTEVDARLVSSDASSAPSVLRGRKYDLIVVGFALNEMFPEEDTESALAFIDRYLRYLAPNGKFLILEPALRAPARKLHRLRDVLAASGRVFAPCLGIDTCPMLARKRDWCHEDVPVALPEPLRSLAKNAGLRYERLTYSYLTLGTDGKGLRDQVTPASFRAVSRLRKSKGKLELSLCGRSTAPTLMRLDRHASPKNAVLDEVHRGDLVLAPPDSTDPLRVRVGAEDALSIVSLVPPAD